MLNGSKPGDTDLDGYLRYVKDFLAWELRRLRPGWAAPPWEPDQQLNRAPFFLDSLELVELAGLLADRFHVRATGAEDYFLARRTPKDWAELLKYTRDQKVPDISFASSGSTGSPRLLTHSWENLVREASFFAQQIQGRTRVVKTVPSHHIYGFLFTWLLPESSGLDVAEQSPEAPDWKPGDLVVTVPFLLGLWLERRLTIPDDVVFTLSTAPFPPELAQSLLDAGGHYYEIFGSSETAGIGWRTRPSRPFELLPWWKVFPGDSERAPFLQQGEATVYEFPDEVEFPEPGFVFPRGRRDGAVQVGGVNVFPARVKAVLEKHTEVAQAAVRPAKDGTSARMKAFIVPRNPQDFDQNALETSLRDWAAQHLSAPERPTSYTFGYALPRSPLGKDADW
ncbi:MAG: 4-coumarate--CoA ligase [Spirochaetales bacterium]|nr:4-coumarate--CoA ligase [Spirochaetales bacterium]